MQRTYIMVKPDGVQRGLIGKIIARIEERGLKLVALKMYTIPENVARAHYGEHEGKPFFKSLLDFITSGPSVSMVVEGKEAIKIMRSTVGSTNPQDASPGTLRGDFSLDMGRNIIHASDSIESADREIGIHFSESEIVSFTRIDEQWIYE